MGGVWNFPAKEREAHPGEVVMGDLIAMEAVTVVGEVEVMGAGVGACAARCGAFPFLASHQAFVVN